MLKKLLVIALSVVALAAAGCGGGDKQAQTTIKVGATAGPHAEVKPYPLSRTFLREREKQQFLPEPLLLSFY